MTWSLLCLAASSDAAGRMGSAVLQHIMAILTLSVEQAGPMAEGFAFVWQKGAHVVLFGVLGALAAGEIDRLKRRLLLLTGGGICIVAEWLQVLTETRYFATADELTNLAAFGLAAAFIQWRVRVESAS